MAAMAAAWGETGAGNGDSDSDCEEVVVVVPAVGEENGVMQIPVVASRVEESEDATVDGAIQIEDQEGLQKAKDDEVAVNAEMIDNKLYVRKK